ncbi:MAG: DUF222 domain-containing protein [Acidimicrobiia bacterium]|jgi:hypothetical protein
MFDTETEVATIPQGLDQMPPGPALAGFLASIDVENLSGRAAVIFARAQQRQISHDQARQYRALSRVTELYEIDSSEAAEFASAEIGAALTYTRRRADSEMTTAYEVACKYPALIDALESGSIDIAKVRTVLRGVGHVNTEVGRKAIDLILPEAPGLTTGQIAARLRKLVIEADPDEAKKAYEEAIANARVWSCLEPDGSGTMLSTGMKAYDLSRANRNINRLARERKNNGDPRSIDQIRAEVFAELLSGCLTPSGGKAEVNITGDLTTLEGLDENTGELNGFGPVHADILRQIVAEQQDSTWTYTIKDPKTGRVYVGTTSRRPTVEQKRKLIARYQTCIHPGCRMPATQCDFDHNQDWAEGGLTELCNLAPLCRYHHRLKHLTAWTYRKLADGSIEWVSQFGLKYVTHPP